MSDMTAYLNDVAVMSADVARGHIGNGGGDECSPPRQIPTGCRGLTTWKESDPDVPRTSPRNIRMRRLPFGLILKTLPEPLKIDKTGQRAWSYAGRMQSSDTREYPSLIQTYFDTHTVDGIFLWVEERLLYEEMLRLKDLGPNTPTGVPYTDDEIMAMVRQGKQRGHIHGVGRSQHEFGSGSGSGGGGDDEPGEDEDADEDKDADGDEDS
ncbi:hypothetical protein Tco_0751957 [Tanacetum coccineum]|uniref:Uncharacterized protein n=1 Tax=Tanacetum coccineum TaxID=301880 RepID=A0ABQ4Z6R6_9ASTR